MPNSYHRDGIFNPHVTIIKDSYDPERAIIAAILVGYARKSASNLRRSVSLFQLPCNRLSTGQLLFCFFFYFCFLFYYLSHNYIDYRDLGAFCVPSLVFRIIFQVGEKVPLFQVIDIQSISKAYTGVLGI